MKLFDLFDLVGFIHKQRLPLITQYTLPDGYQVFEFSTAGMNLSWKAGQHGFFTIPEAKITGTTWRAFSVASIPSENKILIATRIPPEPSSFKQALLALKPGDMITMRGPYGWLYYKDTTSPAVMIAGGVGITPFRAMLKEVEGGTSRTTHLIYSAQGLPPFKDELDQIVNKVPTVSIAYTSTIEDTTLRITEAVNEFGNKAYYFISGAPGMIESIKSNLMKQGIAPRRIVTDAFRGYHPSSSGQPKK
jgi:ferredoxin-NADP reductase